MQPQPATNALAQAEAAVIASARAMAAAINADAPARRLRYALNAKAEAERTLIELLNPNGRWSRGGWPLVSDRARALIERWYRARDRRAANQSIQLRKAA